MALNEPQLTDSYSGTNTPIYSTALVTLIPKAIYALVNQGSSGLFVLAGGSMLVALFKEGVELTGNGYSRQSIAKSSISGDSLTFTLSPVTFVSSSSYNYDEIRLYTADGVLSLGSVESDGTVYNGRPAIITLTLSETQNGKRFFDLSRYGQLSQMPGYKPVPVYDFSHAHPYKINGGELGERQLWNAAEGYSGLVAADYESNIHTTHSAGTISITAGVVQGSGTSFPDWQPAYGYYPRLTVGGPGGQLYFVGSRVDGDTLVLLDSSINVPAGTSYMFAPWDFREHDPQYAAVGEWEAAHDEWALVIQEELPNFRANGGIFCIWDWAMLIFRRRGDIAGLGDGDSYAIWQSQVEQTFNRVTAAGWSYKELLLQEGGYCFYECYCDPVEVSSLARRDRFRLSNQRIVETMDQLEIPTAPALFRWTLASGWAQWYDTGFGVEVPRQLQRQLMADADASVHSSFSFWGPYDHNSTTPRGMVYRTSGGDDYPKWIANTIRQIRYPGTGLNVGLQLLAEFEDTDEDSSGNGHLGRPFNAPTFVTGKLGKARDLEASSSQSVDFGNVDINKTSNFSISYWYRPETNGDYQPHVVNGGADANSRTAIMHGSFGAGTTSGILCAIANGGNVYGYTPTGLLTVGTWADILVTFDGTQVGNANRLKIYVNGVAASLTFSGTIPEVTADNVLDSFVLGKMGVGYADASFDQLAVWNITLPATAATFLYNGGAGRPSTEFADFEA